MNRPPVSVGSLRGTVTVCRAARRGRRGSGTGFRWCIPAPPAAAGVDSGTGFRWYIPARKEVAVPVWTPAAPAVAYERAARRDLRDQIARLERELARELAESFPRREPPRSGRSASSQAGPRLLTLGQL